MERTKEEISRNMSLIKGKDTKIELMLRSALFKLGLRYYKNYSKLVGHPDIYFPTSKVVVFVDGDFWHGHYFDKQKDSLKKNSEYWIEKIEKNMQRDTYVTHLLESDGYIVIRVWEDEIKKDLPRVCDIIYRQVKRTDNPYSDK